jgi:hypothetical protein
MSYLAATGEYGLIVRKPALAEKAIGRDRLSEVMADVDVMDEDDTIISFGPLFGQEASNQLKSDLESCGLTYLDDFCTFDFYVPEWLKVGVASI